MNSPVDVLAAKPIHGAPKPKNVPADMVSIPPVECGFSVGDAVIYTNDYGVKFERTVRGFTREVTSWGAFVYLDIDCWWCPVRADSLTRCGGAK